MNAGREIRRTFAYILMASGIPPFTGGTAVADQSKSGTQSQSGSTMENKSGNAGEGSMKQGHESSGKMKQEPYGRTGEPKAGGEAILGGSGQIPDSSKVPGIPHDKGSVGSGSGDTQTSPGQTGSSGGQGSSGGTQSSGDSGGGGY